MLNGTTDVFCACLVPLTLRIALKHDHVEWLDAVLSQKGASATHPLLLSSPRHLTFLAVMIVFTASLHVEVLGLVTIPSRSQRFTVPVY